MDAVELGEAVCVVMVLPPAFAVVVPPLALSVLVVALKLFPESLVAGPVAVEVVLSTMDEPEAVRAAVALAHVRLGDRAGRAFEGAEGELGQILFDVHAHCCPVCLERRSSGLPAFIRTSLYFGFLSVVPGGWVHTHAGAPMREYRRVGIESCSA